VVRAAGLEQVELREAARASQLLHPADRQDARAGLVRPQLVGRAHDRGGPERNVQVNGLRGGVVGEAAEHDDGGGRHRS